MTRYFARQDEYLEIQDKDGNISIMEGPCSLLFDPIDHKVLHLLHVYSTGDLH